MHAVGAVFIPTQLRASVPARYSKSRALAGAAYGSRFTSRGVRHACASGWLLPLEPVAGQVCNATKQFITTPTVRAFRRIRVSAFPSGGFGRTFQPERTCVWHRRVSGSARATGYVVSSDEPLTRAPVDCERGAEHVVRRPSGQKRTWQPLGPLPTTMEPCSTRHVSELHAGGGKFSIARRSANGFATADVMTTTSTSTMISAGQARPLTYLSPPRMHRAFHPDCRTAGNQWQCVDEDPPSDGSATSLSNSTCQRTFNHPSAAVKASTSPFMGHVVECQGNGQHAHPKLVGCNRVAPQRSRNRCEPFRAESDEPPTGGVDVCGVGARRSRPKTSAGTVSVSAVRLLVVMRTPRPLQRRRPRPRPHPTALRRTPRRRRRVRHPATAGGYVIVGAPEQEPGSCYDHASGAHGSRCRARTLRQRPPALRSPGKNIVVGAPLDDSDGTDAAPYTF